MLAKVCNAAAVVRCPFCSQSMGGWSEWHGSIFVASGNVSHSYRMWERWAKATTYGSGSGAEVKG